MRKLLAVAAGLAILLAVNVGIYQREQLLRDGQIVLLRLAPVDPRSLMQGDYMQLNFELANQAFPWAQRDSLADGHIIVAVDRQRIAQFRRLDDGRPLAAGELKLRYRIRNGRPRFATDSYFFQEGRAAQFQRAQFGEFRVGGDGDMILTGLRDQSVQPLG